MDSTLQNSVGSVEPVDSDPGRRPGVPMIPERPAPYPTVAGKPLEQQQSDREVLAGVEARINVGAEITPVFGTAVPPRGLSGMLRRAAYTIPEHKAGRWMLLMLGDRVDVWEGRIGRHPVAAAVLAAGLGYALARRGRR